MPIVNVIPITHLSDLEQRKARIVRQVQELVMSALLRHGSDIDNESLKADLTEALQLLVIREYLEEISFAVPDKTCVSNITVDMTFK